MSSFLSWSALVHSHTSPLSEPCPLTSTLSCFSFSSACEPAHPAVVLAAEAALRHVLVLGLPSPRGPTPGPDPAPAPGPTLGPDPGTPITDQPPWHFPNQPHGRVPLLLYLRISEVYFENYASPNLKLE